MACNLGYSASHLKLNTSDLIAYYLLNARKTFVIADWILPCFSTVTRKRFQTTCSSCRMRRGYIITQTPGFLWGGEPRGPLVLQLENLTFVPTFFVCPRVIWVFRSIHYYYYWLHSNIELGLLTLVIFLGLWTKAFISSKGSFVLRDSPPGINESSSRRVLAASGDCTERCGSRFFSLVTKSLLEGNFLIRPSSKGLPWCWCILKRGLARS